MFELLVFFSSVSVTLFFFLDCLVLQVDSMNKPRILLKIIQVLCDLDLMITKAYISSDGGWFMDGKHDSKLFFFYFYCVLCDFDFDFDFNLGMVFCNGFMSNYYSINSDCFKKSTIYTPRSIIGYVCCHLLRLL